MTKNTLLITVLLLLLFLMFFFFNYNIELLWLHINDYFTIIHIWCNKHFFLASVIFFSIYVLICLLSLPIATLITVSGGSLLGWIALPLTILGATIGATLFFVYSNKLINIFIKEKSFFVLDKVKQEFYKSPFRWLLVLRLLPILPFFICNIIAAITGMRKTSFLLMLKKLKKKREREQHEIYHV